MGQGRRAHGESWKRLAFLRSIIEADVVNGLTPEPTDEWPWQRVSAASEGDYKLIHAAVPKSEWRCISSQCRGRNYQRQMRGACVPARERALMGSGDFGSASNLVAVNP